MKIIFRICLILGALAISNSLLGCSGTGVINRVTFACDDGGTVTAAFYHNRSVRLDLPGGRKMVLPQTVSADGARFADSSESFVFWTRGNGAFIEEKPRGGDSVRRTYCILLSPDPGGLPNVFENSTKGFSMRYPNGWTVDQSYVYSALGPGEGIHGVSFTVPRAMTRGTNLASDTSLSVELLPGSRGDDAAAFLSDGTTARTVTENGTTYSTATMMDAGAGNRYEQIVYAIPGTRPLLAVRYFIHYNVIENYPAGTVKAFDRKSLIAIFDHMRSTLTVDEANVPRT